MADISYPTQKFHISSTSSTPLLTPSLPLPSSLMTNIHNNLTLLQVLFKGLINLLTFKLYNCLQTNCLLMKGSIYEKESMYKKEGIY
jgi:hypothetical protein